MKASELRSQSDEQLAVTLVDTEKYLFQLRFQSATDRLETPSEIRKARKDIARAKTEQRRRELIKLLTLADDVLAKTLIDLGEKADGSGKRRVKRAIIRLTAIQDIRKQTTATEPVKGK